MYFYEYLNFFYMLYVVIHMISCCEMFSIHRRVGSTYSRHPHLSPFPSNIYYGPCYLSVLYALPPRLIIMLLVVISEFYFHVLFLLCYKYVIVFRIQNRFNCILHHHQIKLNLKITSL